MTTRAWAVVATILLGCGPHEDVTPMITVQPGAPARAMALMGRTGANEKRPIPAVDAGDDDDDAGDADEESRLVFACLESFGAVGALARLPCVATLEPIGGAGDAGAGAADRMEVVAADGKVSVAVAPGRYRVTVAREPDYVAAHFDVTVGDIGKTWGPNEGAVVLTRIVDTHGYLAADAAPHGFGEGDVRRLMATWVAREAAKGGDPVDVWSTDDVDARTHATADFMARLLAKAPVTPVASGDVRTYVRVDNATQATPWDAKREADVTHGVRDRRDVVLSNGPFLRVTTNGASIGGVARTTPATRDVTVSIHVECPAGVAVDRITILRARAVVTPPETVTLRAPPRGAPGVRVADVSLHLRAISDDAFVVIAEGAAGARAMTGAVWIDADGDGESFGRKVDDAGDAPLPLRDKKAP